jgi:rubrerythrin
MKKWPNKHHHIRILSEQFRAYQNNKQFDSEEFEDQHESDITAQVLAKEIKSEISAAAFEAAAISAAMSMEERAIKLYSDRAAAATDPNEQALYNWLTKWETQHLSFLADIDRELTEDIWYDQSFWPF